MTSNFICGDDDVVAAEGAAHGECVVCNDNAVDNNKAADMYINTDKYK